MHHLNNRISIKKIMFFEIYNLSLTNALEM